MNFLNGMKYEHHRPPFVLETRSQPLDRWLIFVKDGIKACTKGRELNDRSDYTKHCGAFKGAFDMDHG